MFTFRHLTTSIVTGAIALAATATLSSAATYQVSTLNGSQGFGYDTDQAAPEFADGGGANGIAFYSNVNGQGGNPNVSNDGNKRYTSVRFTPAAIGMTGLTLGDISSIVYDTKKVSGLRDWQVKVYTDTATSPSWFAHRVNFDSNDADHDWTTYTLDGSTQTQSLHQRNVLPTANVETYDQSFSSIQASIGSEAVLFFDISASYLSANNEAPIGPKTSYAYLDNIVIAASGFETATVTAVPEPASLAVAGIAGLGLLARRRRA
ncbi:MAG TPA: PEP-CTERM sorting domain-containing protein [Tepidisphaeraceae bacterium]|jgi:hypothetical protein|nr:PEP-CTERM sorting domain-containing protein [Tepidisphaeraceae bacterium]